MKRDLEHTEYNDFIPLAHNTALEIENKEGIGGIFEVYRSGIKTSNDDVAIQPKKSTIHQIIDDFKSLEIQELIAKFDIKNPNKADWNVVKVKNDILQNKGEIIPIVSKPFDTQYTYYTGKQGFIARQRFDIMQHFLLGQNIGLSFQRGLNGGNVFATNNMISINFLQAQTYIAPLYLYTEEIDGTGKVEIKQSINFTTAFKNYIKRNKVLQDKSHTQILAYIYATLYNPTYQEKYKEYLKIGFPRVSFEVSTQTFEALESIGDRLIALHTLKSIPKDSKITLDFRDGLNTGKAPNQTLEALRGKDKRYFNNTIFLNSDLVIKNVSPEVYNYTIGGYCVIEKYLSYRKDYECTKEELEHLVNICKVLEATLELQKELKTLPIS